MAAFVSVIIPTYRDGDDLRRALASVEDQTLQPSQVIVVDDASADSNADKVCRASKLKNLQLVTLDKNVGPGGARNAGIAAAKEPFLAFLDADDEWHPEKLTRQMSAMSAQGAAFSCHRKSFNGASWSAFTSTVKLAPLRRKSILFSNYASISTVIVRKDAIKYEFPQTYAGEDYLFVAAIILSGAPSILLDESLARAHKNAYGASGLSGKMHDMQLGEMSTRNFLFRQGLVSRLERVIADGWSLLKYCRRVAIVMLRRLSV